MARNTTIANLTQAIRAPFQKRSGQNLLAATTANASRLPSWAADNTSEQRWRNAANTDDIRAMSVDANDNIQVGEEVFSPMRRTIKFNVATAASLVTQQFMIIPAACRLVGITEIHATAESTAATMTAYVEKLTGTTAPGSGTTVMSGTFNMKATANTMQTATLTTTGTADSDAPDLQFAAGDRIGIKFSVAGTELAGVVVSITLAPAGTGEWVVYNMQANGDLVDQSFFLANRDYIVTAAYEVHSVLGTNGSAVNVQLVKDTSTNAPGAGTDMLTNSTNNGFDLKGTINTVQTGVLATTAGLTRLAPGDRLSVDFAGTLTAVAGVVVVVVLQAVKGRKEITWTLSKNGNLGVDQAFYIADRNYQITDATCVFSVAAGGASKVQLVRDKLTDAPGAGVDLLSNNTSAGFDFAATANTVQIGTWVDARFNYLMTGDRLAVDFANAAQSSAGATITVSLIPA